MRYDGYTYQDRKKTQKTRRRKRKVETETQMPSKEAPTGTQRGRALRYNPKRKVHFPKLKE